MGKGAKVKGYLELDGVIGEFMYNPEQFDYNYSTDYAVIKAPGSPHPVYQFVGGNERTITTTLLIDGREKGTILQWTSLLGRSYPANRSKDKNKFLPPPIAYFALGTFAKRVLIKDVTWRFTMWDKNLVPIRAEVDLVMETVL